MIKLTLGLLAAGLALAGCEDVADRLAQPVVQAPPQSQVFAAEPAAVFAAARAALNTMDYRLTHGGPAEGRLEAVSDIVPGDAPDTTKQVSIRAQFDPAEGGGTRVTVWVNQVSVEQTPAQNGPTPAETPGGVSDMSMAGGPLADTLFRAIQMNLNHSQPQ